MKRYTLAGFAALAAAIVTLPAAAQNNAGQGEGGRFGFGRVEKAQEIVGSNIHDQQNQNLGKVSDVVVDLPSGRVLYAVVDQGGGQLFAVPPAAFRMDRGGDRAFTVNFDRNKLGGAPRYQSQQQPGNTGFMQQVYNYFGVAPWWEGSTSFENARTVSSLMQSQVQNVSNQPIGNVRDLAINLNAARVLYVIFQPGGSLQAQNNQLYALPPMAFTVQGGNLVSDLDQNRIASAPAFQGGNWESITNPSYAQNVYRYYGKQPFWDTSASYSAAGNPNNNSGSTWNQGQTATPNYPPSTGYQDPSGQASAQNYTPQSGEQFGQLTGVNRLEGAALFTPQGKPIGHLNDVVVDLESGRVLYGIITPAGVAAGNDTSPRAIAPALFAYAPQFRQQGGNKAAFTINVDSRKILNAPRISPDAPATQLGSISFVSQVHQHFGQNAWWQGGSGIQKQNFALVHRGHEFLGGLRVQDVSNGSLGRTANLLLDLPSSRAAFVLLEGDVVGKPQQYLPIPPMAFTRGPDHATLVSNLDRSRLQAAPSLPGPQLKRLNDLAFDRQVYTYYGKQVWWENMPTPTGR